MCLCLGGVKGESRKCPPLNVVRSRRSNIRQTVGRRDGVCGGESAANGACSQREV